MLVVQGPGRCRCVSLPALAFLGSNGTVASFPFQQDSMNRYGALSSQHKILKVGEESGLTCSHLLPFKECFLEEKSVFSLTRDAQETPRVSCQHTGC